MNNRKRRFQFSIKRMLIVTAVVASLLPFLQSIAPWISDLSKPTNITVPDGGSMIIGGRVIRRFNQPYRPAMNIPQKKELAAGEIATSDASNSEPISIVITTAPRIIIEEQSKEESFLPNSITRLRAAR